MAPRRARTGPEDPRLVEPRDDEPRWAWQLLEACRRLGGHLPTVERDRLRGEAWLLLRTSLTRYLRQHAARLGPVSPEAIEDVAAEKSLELLRRAEGRLWNLRGREGRQVAAFLSSVARHGVIDFLRASGPRRLVSLVDEAMDDSGGALAPSLAFQDPDARLEASEFAAHLMRGLEPLKPRVRIAWFLRVFFDWPSRRIAEHPGVRMSAGHVDVELQRTRRRVRRWMESAGYDVREIPPGTVTALWGAWARAQPDPSTPAGNGTER
jgi:DNA-directed RNA polymerase specialized sigma24 family protein